jgi:hypothetical protein
LLPFSLLPLPFTPFPSQVACHPGIALSSISRLIHCFKQSIYGVGKAYTPPHIAMSRETFAGFP